MSLVSVIIPNYNHAPYLQQRIESVLAQTFQDFELILLDDCSSDNSRDIIDQYRNHHKVSHIIYNQVNSGSTFYQWKKGLELAKSDWIWIAESDDFAAPDFLNTLFQTINSDTNVVFSSSNIIDEYNNIFDIGIKNATWVSDHIHRNDFEQDFEISGNDFLYKYLLFSNVIYNASAVLFRRTKMLKYIDDVTNWKLYGDWYLWIKLIADGRVSYRHKPLNYFRCHTNNVRTGTKAETSAGENAALGEMLQQMILEDTLLSEVQRKNLVLANKKERKKTFKQLQFQIAATYGLFKTIQKTAAVYPELLWNFRFVKGILASSYRKKN